MIERNEYFFRIELTDRLSDAPYLASVNAKAKFFNFSGISMDTYIQIYPDRLGYLS